MVERGGNIRSFVTVDVTAANVGRILAENISPRFSPDDGQCDDLQAWPHRKAICATPELPITPRVNTRSRIPSTAIR